MIEIRVSGTEDSQQKGETSASDLGVGITVKEAINVSLARAADAPVTIQAADDDVVELEMEDGATLWLRADELGARMASGSDRGAGDAGVVEVPARLPLDDGARGIGDWVIKALRVLDIDLPAKTALTVAEAFEKKAMISPGLTGGTAARRRRSVMWRPVTSPGCCSCTARRPIPKAASGTCPAPEQHLEFHSGNLWPAHPSL